MNEQPDKTPEESVEKAPGKQDFIHELEKAGGYRPFFKNMNNDYRITMILETILVWPALIFGGWWWLVYAIVTVLFLYVCFHIAKAHKVLKKQDSEKYIQHMQDASASVQSRKPKDIKIFFGSYRKDENVFAVAASIIIALALAGWLWGLIGFYIFCGLMFFAIFFFIRAFRAGHRVYYEKIQKKFEQAVTVSSPEEQKKSNTKMILKFIGLLLLGVFAFSFEPYIQPFFKESIFKSELAVAMSEKGEVENVKKTAPLIYEVKFKNGEVFRVVMNDKKNKILMADRRFIPDPKEHNALIPVLKKNRIPQNLFYGKVKGGDNGILSLSNNKDKRLFKSIVFYYYEDGEKKAFIVRQKPNGEIYLDDEVFIW